MAKLSAVSTFWLRKNTLLRNARPLWRFALRSLQLLFQVLRVFALVFTVGLIVSLLDSEAETASKVMFAQWTCEFALFSGVSYQLSKFFECASSPENSVFAGTKHLKITAGLFLAIFIAALVFTVISRTLEVNNLFLPTLSCAIFGFPSYEGWSSGLPASECTLQELIPVDLSPLIIALILWGVSYALEYSRCLDDEMEHVI